MFVNPGFLNQHLVSEPDTGSMEASKGKDDLVSLKYPMLSKNNYAAWAIKMKVFMQAQGVWDAVEPTDSKDTVETGKDKKAMAAIYQGIPEETLLLVAEKQTAKEAWPQDDAYGRRAPQEREGSERVRGPPHEGDGVDR